MTTILFLSPDEPQLVLSGVPATFVNGISDVDDLDVDRISRMRYLGAPYGVIEMGETTAADPSSGTTMAAIVEAVNNPSSTLGAALREAFIAASALDTVTTDLSQVKEQVASLTDSANGLRTVLGFGTPESYDGSGQPDGTVLVLMPFDPTTV